MKVTIGRNDSVRRRRLLQMLGLLGSSAFTGTAIAHSQRDDRAEIDREFARLLDEHGQATEVGRKRFDNDEIMTNGNAPENVRNLFSNERFDIVGAINYAFEDDAKKTVALGRNPGEGLMVYVDGKYFVTKISNADRQAMATARKQINSNIEDQIQTALQERYSSDEYREAGR